MRAFGEARRLSDLVSYAAGLGIAAPGERRPIEHLRQSGYVSVNRGPWSLIFDVANVGPDYIPGHAHADTLAFELRSMASAW